MSDRRATDVVGPDPGRRDIESVAVADLAALAWVDVAPSAAASLLAVPIGSTEQHGPHLPLATDTLVAVALCRRLAEARSGVVVAPALPYGSSGEHAGFAGTLSIGQDALHTVLVELARSADAFAGVVFVSGHAGNAEPLAAAVATLTAEGRSALGWVPRLPDADAHAGRTETSLLLHLAPDLVALERAEPGDLRPLAEIIGILRTGGVGAVSPNGILGDPTGASAAEGAVQLGLLTEDLVAAVASFRA